MRPTFFVVFHVMCLCSLCCASKDVSCVFEESCVLPCSFTPGEDLVIHWKKDDTEVYKYYEGQPQLQLQHEVYRGRTSLSDPGVQTGNASLQLHRVTVSDEGRYRCYVSTSSSDVTDSYVNLRVYGFSCLIGKSCVLPCSFTPGKDPVIHWTKEEAPVYNYYKGQHQLHLQHEVYRGQTSLSDPGIQTGNASLQLHRVTVRDEGRYRCYVTTISSDDVTDSYINLGVYAPVLRLALQKEEEQLICSSDNIYPRPAVTWTFSPEPADNQTSIRPSQTGLFSVLSSVPLTQRPPLEYTCNISTEHSWRSATYRRNPPIISTDSDSEVTIHCAPNSSSSITSLVWTFNHTQTIVNQTGSEPVYCEAWKQSVHVSQSGDLRLQGLTKQLEGLFSCELTTDRQTYSVHTQLIFSEGDLLIALIVGLCIGVLALIAVVIAVTRIPRKDSTKQQKLQSEQKMKPYEGNSESEEPEGFHLEESGMMTNIRYNYNDRE